LKKQKRKAGDFKKDLRREILEIFQRNPKKPLNHKQVAAELGIKDSGVRTLVYELLRTETDNGKLKEIEHGKFILLASEQTSLEGVIQITKFGRGFVSIPGMKDDIEIAKGNTGFALWGDTVEIQFNSKARRPEARVTRVVERGKKNYVGIIEMSKDHAFFIPSDQKIHVDFYIPKELYNGAKHGEKVIAEITEWTKPDRKPFGRITKVLGKPGSHQVEMHAIIAEFGLPYEFPEEVIADSEKIATDITADEIAKRRDFRKISTFTIDPFDAKDFDDALSYRKLENGLTEVGIHIADVSHYMKPDTMLEKEAYVRATSVYLVDRTIPMLPERLSNELCSLRPKEEKLCFSAVFEMDDDANLKSSWFGRTVIYSDRRFTYEEAQEIIETRKGDFADEITHLDMLAKKMRAKRFQAGAIDFNTEEVKFKLDDMGKPVGVTIKVMKDSNQLIEEFMLLANKKVGEFIGKNKVNGQERTYVYRIHDTPDDGKLLQLKTFIKHLGYSIPRQSNINPSTLIKSLMEQVKGHAEEDIIKNMAIRTMAKAEYSTNNIGHFGLSFEYYSHFTSPIRRYPDVMAHRLLQHYLDGGNSVNPNDYEVKCKHSSLMEKRASEAERASIKYKQVEYMLDHTGKIFEGIVSGLTSWGFYVEVGETKSEGMVSLRNLADDHYEFDADKYIIRGLRSRTELHMGDKVTIKVMGGNLNQRTLDYQWVKK
jgi:ribonuclease R